MIRGRKTGRYSLFLVLACTGLLAMPVAAQTFKILHTFAAGTGDFYITNSDGANPQSALILSSNTLYGTASFGTANGDGTVFAIHTDGTGFTNLHNFAVLVDQANGDGAIPQTGLILSGNTFYGVTAEGGADGYGTVFAVNNNGTGFTNLYNFNGAGDGAVPVGGMVLSGKTLYGTTSFGGQITDHNSENGNLFAINTNGTDFANIYGFTAGTGGFVTATNSDGAYPIGGLILSDNTLYGTALYGGTNDHGTVFAVNVMGANFMTLHNFTGGSDGAYPGGGLILSGNTLYGTTIDGGANGDGVVFSVKTDGTDFTNMHSFTGGDGANPQATFILSGNTLFGAAADGGIAGNGTVFKINTDGTGFATLYNFKAGTGSNPEVTNSDGAAPLSALVLSGNTLYGTAYYGGTNGNGTVFSLSLPVPPPLTVISSGADIILTWPTNVMGFTLQSTTNLIPPAVWNAVSPAPAILNTNNEVTNAISGKQQFYRLSL